MKITRHPYTSDELELSKEDLEKILDGKILHQDALVIRLQCEPLLEYATDRELLEEMGRRIEKASKPKRSIV